MNAIITGGTKGIGYAIAEIFAQNGYNIWMNSRNEEDLSRAKAELEAQFKIEVNTRKTDMSVSDEVKSFAHWVNDSCDSIDVLVNNAGIFIPGAISEEEDGHLQKMIDTNLYSAYHLTRALLVKMIAAKKGHIFNICSIASKFAYPNGGSYSISKFALYGFSQVLRSELMDKGIKVTAVMPGATWSNSWAGVDLPNERLMEARDIAMSIFSASQLSPSAVVEEITLRPQLGDL